MINQERAKEKTTLILKNSLKSFIEKFLSETSLPYEISDIEDSYMSGPCVDYNGLRIDKNLLKLTLGLTDWARGIAFIPFSCNPIKVKQFLTLEKHSEQERIDSFSEICEENEFDYDISYESEKIFCQIAQKIEEIGGETFRLKNGDGRDQKMFITLGFKKNYSLSFQIYYYEHEKFLKSLADFTEDLRKNDFKDYSELYHRVEKSSLREFWVVTKKVLRAWAKECGDNKIEFERLTKNLHENLFEFNSEVEHVILPDGMKEIPACLFAKCENLKSVVIPESVEKIGRAAFLECINLREVNFRKI